MTKILTLTNGLMTNISGSELNDSFTAKKFTWINGICTNIVDASGLSRTTIPLNFINGFLVSSGSISGSVTPPPSSDCTRLDADPTGPYGLSTTGDVKTTGSTVITKIDTAYHCKIRDGMADNPTMLSVTGTNYTTSGSDGGYVAVSGSETLVVSAYDATGTDILFGVQQSYSGSAYGERQFLFSPDHPTEVYGFRFRAANLSGSATNTFAKVSSIISGSYPLYSSDGVDISSYESDPDQLFYLESSGGPIFYQFILGGEIAYDYFMVKKAYYGGGSLAFIGFGYDSTLGAYDATPYPYILYVDQLDGLHGIAYFKRPLIGGAHLYWDKIGDSWNIPSSATYVSGTMNFDFGYAVGDIMIRKFTIDNANIANVCAFDDP